jgi:hypothetical protein
VRRGGRRERTGRGGRLCGEGMREDGVVGEDGEDVDVYDFKSYMYNG